MDLKTKTVMESYTILARVLRDNGTVEKPKVHKRRPIMEKEPEKTISGLIKTIFDWDNLDLIEEARELLSNIYEPSVQMTPEWVGERLRVNEFGQIVHPPIEPEEPDTSKWKRMTPKRVEMLTDYRMALAEYKTAMKEWLELPLLDDGSKTTAEHRIEFIRNRPSKYGINHRAYYDYIQGVFEYEVPVLSYYARGFGEVRVTAFPVRHTELEVVDCDPTNNYWTQLGFEGNASHERRHYKRNRSIPREEWADTNIETGEACQQTLFTCNTSSPRKVASLNILESFIAKPNKYLAEAYLDYIVNETPLTDWQRFQLRKRDSVRTWSIH